MRKLETMPIMYLGKQVGFYRQDFTFITYRRREHFFIRYHGFGLSFTVIKRLRELGCTTVKILYNNDIEVRKYTARLKDFIEYGIIYVNQNDYQRILDTKYMVCE